MMTVASRIRRKLGLTPLKLVLLLAGLYILYRLTSGFLSHTPSSPRQTLRHVDAQSYVLPGSDVDAGLREASAMDHVLSRRPLQLPLDPLPTETLKPWTWREIDARPNPTWYDDAKFGVFIHWGVFSVPAYISEWFWFYWKGKMYHAHQEPMSRDAQEYMNKYYPPGFSYADFGPQFTARFFDAKKWAKIVAESGAKYVVLTSKHHEGFTLWPSKWSFNWNAVDVGPHRDLLAEYFDAFRNTTDLKVGVYYSLYEWFNRLYLLDKASDFATDKYVKYKMLPELLELITRYEPDIVWPDGQWEAPDTYWNSRELLTWLYTQSSVKDRVVVNDRWGSGITNKFGGFFTGGDRFIPGSRLPHKWENCMTIDRQSWGFRRNVDLSSFMTMDNLTDILAETVAKGGNLLMNVGPTAEGIIPPIYEERLKQMGAWLRVNGEAIYASQPWFAPTDPAADRKVWFTRKDATLYAIVTEWPRDNVLHLSSVVRGDDARVTLLGYGGDVTWGEAKAGGLEVTMPVMSETQRPCDWAWVLKLQGVKHKED